MNSTLAGKVALVTGGARGIGAATCRELAALGAEVVVTDVLDDEGTALADELRQSGHKAFYRHLDVADEDAWSETVAEVIARSGRLDILVNNARIGTFEDVEAETVAGYQKVIGINQVGVWLGMRAAIPQMRAQGSGSIINVSSIFGAVGGFGGSVAYHASKGAVRLMTKNGRPFGTPKRGSGSTRSIQVSSTRRWSRRPRGPRWKGPSWPIPRWGAGADRKRSQPSSDSWPVTEPAT